MKRLLFAFGVVILMTPVYSQLYAQDDISLSPSDILGQLSGGQGNRGGGQRGPVVPDPKEMFTNIKNILKNGKTPLDKPQEGPLQSLLNSEIVTLNDKLQLLKNNNNGGNTPAEAAGGRGRGGRGGAGEQAAQPANPQATQANALLIQVDTITTLKNDDFLSTKLPLFLSAEQVALVQKAHADDKADANCLGGLFDRYYQQIQNPNRGNAGNNNQNQNQNRGNFNQNANATRPGGQKYCMTMEATPLERLEPIRKVLAKGNLPLGKDKDPIAEIVMKSQLQDLEAALRAGVNQGNTGRGGNNQQNRNNNPQQVIQSSTDNIYKKVEAMLKPPQAETLKMWHFTQMLDRGGVETLIAVEAMQDTPLTDEQVAKVTAAWPELRNQLQQLAKQANKNLTQKEIDGAAMNKILDMLEPSQVASYQLAKKYGPQGASGKP